MDTKLLKGRLDRWNNNKGFGFIRSEGNVRDVFLHISAFKKNISRRPKVGDIVFYQIHTTSDGKIRAVDAKIERLTSKSVNYKSRKPKIRKNNKWIPKGIFILFIIVTGIILYKKFTIDNWLRGEVTSIPKKSESYTKEYSCQGKVYCSDMSSCDEAKFYQHNCPGTKMDGDGDGVPCESQWCGW